MTQMRNSDPVGRRHIVQKGSGFIGFNFALWFDTTNFLFDISRLLVGLRKLSVHNSRNR